MKKLSLTLALVLMITLLSACGGGAQKTFSALSDFQGAKIASQTGTSFDTLINPVIPNVQNMYLNDLSGQIMALQSDKADACALDEPVAKLVVAQNPNLVLFPDVVVTDTYGFAFQKGNAMAQKAQAVVEKLRADGIIDEMNARWFGGNEADKVLPELNDNPNFDGSAGTLKFGYDPVLEPMIYIGKDGAVLGFDIELASRIAYALNMKLELVPTSVSARVEAVMSGKIDATGGCMSVTEERKKNVDFASYYNGGIRLVVKKDRLK